MQTAPVSRSTQSTPVRRVLVVVSEDDGQPAWIADDEDLKVAVVWSYEDYESIPEDFRDLARQFGFATHEEGEG